MANATTEEVSIAQEELESLRRDRMILNRIEAEFRRVNARGPSLRASVGGLIDAQRTIDEILANHLRRLDDRAAAGRRPAQDPTRSRVG